jgi:hypothetical protein
VPLFVGENVATQWGRYTGGNGSGSGGSGGHDEWTAVHRPTSSMEVPVSFGLP